MYDSASLLLLTNITMSEKNEIIKKVNPRSTGELSLQLYRKHSEEICLESEAEELKRCLQESLQTRHVHTAELISFDQEKNILSTRRINGDELFLTIWNPTSMLGKLRGYKLQDVGLISSRIKELGSWLSLYHESTRYPKDSSVIASWLHDSAISKLQGIRENGLLADKKINRIEQRLLREIDKLNHEEYLVKNNLNFCKIHGDFIIYNMLIDNKRDIHIIDFGDTRVACNIDDVVRFYSNLWAISHTNHWRKSMFLRVANDFLTAYGLSSDIVETPYFKAMMAYNFLIHLYGQFCMRDLLSFVSNMELNQVTRAGLRWIDKNFI